MKLKTNREIEKTSQNMSIGYIGIHQSFYGSATLYCFGLNKQNSNLKKEVNHESN
jgi:hypothetical protein